MIRKFITRFLLFHFILLGVVGLLFAQSGQYFPINPVQSLNTNNEHLTPGSIAIIIADATPGKTHATNIVEAIPEYQEEDTSDANKKHLRSSSLLSFISTTAPTGLYKLQSKSVLSNYGNPESISTSRQHLILQVFRI